MPARATTNPNPFTKFILSPFTLAARYSVQISWNMSQNISPILADILAPAEAEPDFLNEFTVYYNKEYTAQLFKASLA